MRENVLKETFCLDWLYSDFFQYIRSTLFTFASINTQIVCKKGFSKTNHKHQTFACIEYNAKNTNNEKEKEREREKRHIRNKIGPKANKFSAEEQIPINVFFFAGFMPKHCFFFASKALTPKRSCRLKSDSICMWLCQRSDIYWCNFSLCLLFSVAVACFRWPDAIVTNILLLSTQLNSLTATHGRRRIKTHQTAIFDART